MSEQAFAEGSFTAPQDRRERLTRAVRAHLAADAGVRLLDLGCGNGLQLLDLASAFPRAHLVGIDTSAANIEAARRAAAAGPHERRVRFVNADYLSFESEPFDVILADSVLQNIAVADSQLYPKLAGDLDTGGLLIASIPYACSYNRVLWWVRRGMRVARGPGVQRLALAVAARLHPDWDRALLEERIPYLYMLPQRIDDAEFADALAGLGLERVAVHALAHASLAQPKHRLSIFRKRSAP